MSHVIGRHAPSTVDIWRSQLACGHTLSVALRWEQLLVPLCLCKGAGGAAYSDSLSFPSDLGKRRLQRTLPKLGWGDKNLRCGADFLTRTRNQGPGPQLKPEIISTSMLWSSRAHQASCRSKAKAVFKQVETAAHRYQRTEGWPLTEAIFMYLYILP